MPHVALQQCVNAQRVGFLVVVPRLLRQFGVDPSEVLSAVGLDIDALDNPNGTIPYESMGLLVATAAERTGCSHLGLLIGQQIKVASLGLIGELMRNAPTVGAALKDFVGHQHRNSHGSVAYLVEQDDWTVFGYTIYQPRMQAVPHIYDGAAAAAFNTLNELRAPESEDGMRILFSREQPVHSEPYERFFCATLQFDAGHTGVSFPRAWLDLPIIGADPGLRVSLERRVADYWLAGDLDIVTQLRRLLRVTLLHGQPADDEIAGRLGMQPRQLHRLLRAKGCNFKRVLNELRFELARQLLENTTLGLAPISAILGFAHVNVFSRAFIRWAGIPAANWRVRTGK